MGQTKQRLEQGDYAYSSHTVLVCGDIAAVFVGKWETQPNGSRLLRKFSRNDEVEGGELLCMLRLRRPMSIKEYRESHHSAFRPVVRSPESEVELVLMPARMVCTIPDGM
jgi:hypothetical protein